MSHKKKHPAITINLTHGARVCGQKHKVTGRVWPSNQHVQVLVLSADNQWYTQTDAVVHKNGRWNAEMTLGFPDSVHDFTVVATSGEKIKESPLAEVPTTHTTSQRVLVTRID
jgi:hypothetical protein